MRTRQFLSAVIAAIIAITTILTAGQADIVKAEEDVTISYRTHVQDYGWQEWKSDGEMSGTTGESKRLEAIQIELDGITGGVRYKTHVQSYGWQEWKYSGMVSGTSGESKRLEAIQIELTGYAKTIYDIYYRVHAQHFGWLDWAKNGEIAGTAGYSYRLESIQIKLVKKGDTAPTNTTTPYHVAHIRYQTHVQNIGWQGLVGEGIMSGTSGKSYRLEGIKIQLANIIYDGNVEYKTHVQNEGWQDWVKNGQMSGTSGKSYRLEGIRIRLTGEVAEHYDIYYRTHVQNIGWQDWVKNGEMSGTSGKSLRLEGIEIKMVEKGGTAPTTTTTTTTQETTAPTTVETTAAKRAVTYYRDTLGYSENIKNWASANGITLPDISGCKTNWYNLHEGIDSNDDEVYAQALAIWNSSAAGDAYEELNGYRCPAASEFCGFRKQETKYVYE